jgi:multiple sugar transport system substrate-binding protein
MFSLAYGSRALGSGLVISLGLVLAACGGGSSNSATQAATAKGPINIWYSNNAEEITWGTATVAAWNTAHADQIVAADQIPAGKSSEEVIGAAITAGTTPCLIFNTAPAAVPQFQKAVGLVSLSDFSDGITAIESRSGDRASQYKSPDGKYYQMPWKTNPVMIFYNKDIFQKAGLSVTDPPLKTYADFLNTSATLVSKGGVKAAIWPSTASDFYQPWFDFYPLFVAQTNGKLLVDKGVPQFADADGLAVANFWKQLYAQNLAPKEQATGDAFVSGQAAMAIAGPWAISVYGDKLSWGVVPVPTKDGMPASGIHTFSDEKSIGMYSSCKNRGTAWEFLKFATNKDNDGALLNLTGQMPMRTDLATAYPDYFQAHPAYTMFADAASRTVEVPNVPNSVQMWQTFRDAYSKSVISGTVPVEEAFPAASDAIKKLVSQ